MSQLPMILDTHSIINDVNSVVKDGLHKLLYEYAENHLTKELEKFGKLQTKVKSDLLPAVKLINKVKEQALKIGVKFKDIPALVEMEKIYWPLNKLAKQYNFI